MSIPAFGSSHRICRTNLVGTHTDTEKSRLSRGAMIRVHPIFAFFLGQNFQMRGPRKNFGGDPGRSFSVTSDGVVNPVAIVETTGGWRNIKK